jgi:hypothetical protein
MMTSCRCLVWFELVFGGYVGEPATVSGVRLLLEVCDEWFRTAEGTGALKTEDAVLAWELADPTPFSISPGRDSLSSVCTRAISHDEGSILTPSR